VVENEVANPTYLNLQALARIRNLQLLARTVVEGFVLGLHKSPFHGSSVEFSEYRPYSAGDEIKRIDWKLFAKVDRYYVKQYEAETNLVCNILLDASASMAYQSKPEGLSKLQYGCFLAACLAHFMIGQRDSTGLTIFDQDVRSVIPPKLTPTHLRRILTELEATKPGQTTQVAGAMNKLADTLKRRGLVVLISDLLDDVDAIKAALKRFRFQGHDIIIFHVMDNAELTFPFDRMMQVQDLESGQSTLVSPASMRETYMGQLKSFLSSCEKAAADVKADYKLFDTTTPLEIALSEYLYKRSSLG
jgi:uncharacterized protein (DUF58 family)